MQSLVIKTQNNSIHFNHNITGEVLGGNLSIIYSLLGTKNGINFDNKILLIEDIGEYLYHLDRMMIALKNANKLSNLKALLVGGMSDMNDNTIPFGKTPYEIILEHTQGYGYPIIFDVPVGHIDDNQAFALGSELNIECLHSSNGLSVISIYRL
jgi:muramoyltetrapeptide carboxypeptidase